MKQNKTSEIFSKEVLTISDLEFLYNLTYSGAAKLMRELKEKGDRLQMKGRIHKQDYFQHYNLNPADYEKKEVA